MACMAGVVEAHNTPVVEHNTLEAVDNTPEEAVEVERHSRSHNQDQANC